MRKLQKFPVVLLLIIILAALLRLPYLDRFPPGLYSDEVSQGYNAYSILKTGRDEHGTFLPVSIRSFGDWKPPLQTYLMIPAIAFFGLNEWGVRLPSAILGVASILVAYFFAIELLGYFGQSDSKSICYSNRHKIALLVALLITLSPWHILQSRSAMLVIVALFFILLALWSFFRGLKNQRYWYLSSVSFVLATYAYYGMRLIVPFLLILLFMVFRHQIMSRFKQALLGGGMALILLLPLGVAYFNEPDVIWGRAKTVSVFYDRGVELTVWDQIAQDGVGMPPKLAQFFHNRPYAYFIDIIRRFFQHFDGRFLFLQGDLHPPFQIPGMGIIYPVEGVLMVAGIYFLSKSDRRLLLFILSLVAISILPAALTFVTPSANRTFTAVFPLVFLSSVGLIELFNQIKKCRVKLVVAGGIAALYIASFTYFVYQYTVILPHQHADFWHYGYKELASRVKSLENQYEIVTLYTKPSVAYIFFLFYNQTDPRELTKLVRRNYHQDEFGFEMVERVGKLQFLREFNWFVDGDRLPENTLLVVSGEEKPGGYSRTYDQIRYPDGQVAFTLYELSRLP